jgi:diguanylate cyclase (GGDEF)-like protein
MKPRMIEHPRANHTPARAPSKGRYAPSAGGCERRLGTASPPLIIIKHRFARRRSPGLALHQPPIPRSRWTIPTAPAYRSSISARRSQDGVLAVEDLLSTGSLATRCHWFADAESLPEDVPAPAPRCLLVLNPEELPGVDGWRRQHADNASVVLVTPTVDENTIEQAMTRGAQDVVTLDADSRFRAVVEREIRLAGMNAALQQADEQLDSFRQQVEKLTTESSRAFLWAQEGIVADANLACVTLLGRGDVTEVIGLPVIDVFDSADQAKLKSAIVACQKGRPAPDTLDCRVTRAAAPALSVEACLESGVFDGERAVRIELRTDGGDTAALSLVPDDSTASEADHDDNPPTRRPDTGIGDPLAVLRHRRHFLQQATTALERAKKTGVRVLFHVRVDKLNTLAERWGPLGLEEILSRVADIVADVVHEGDIWGQLAGASFCVLADREEPGEVEAWGEELSRRVQEETVTLSGEEVAIRICIGAAIRGRTDDFTAMVSKAARASRKAQETATKGVILNDPRNATLEETQDDRRNVKRIQQALRTNAFKLKLQPIADLEERPDKLYDVLLRMLDDGDREILPGTFLPAAERNGLMKAIDRWVIAQAIHAAREQTDTRLFVRISRDTLPDQTLFPWLKQQLVRCRVKPHQIVLQVTQANALDNLPAAGNMAQVARRLGCGFAIEHFNPAEERRVLLDTLPLDYLKIDGALMPALSTDLELQGKVQQVVDEARARNVIAIAEQVEQASTMATLWSLGVQYIQGYYVQGHCVQAPDQTVGQHTIRGEATG